MQGGDLSFFHTVHHFVDHDQQGRLRLQATALTAAAQLIIIKKREMAEFAGKPVVAPEKFATQDKAQPNTPTDVDDHCGTSVARRAKTELCERDKA